MSRNNYLCKYIISILFSLSLPLCLSLRVCVFVSICMSESERASERERERINVLKYNTVFPFIYFHIPLHIIILSYTYLDGETRTHARLKTASKRADLAINSLYWLLIIYNPHLIS